MTNIRNATDSDYFTSLFTYKHSSFPEEQASREAAAYARAKFSRHASSTHMIAHAHKVILSASITFCECGEQYVCCAQEAPTAIKQCSSDESDFFWSESS